MSTTFFEGRVKITSFIHPPPPLVFLVFYLLLGVEPSVSDRSQEKMVGVGGRGYSYTLYIYIRESPFIRNVVQARAMPCSVTLLPRTGNFHPYLFLSYSFQLILTQIEGFVIFVYENLTGTIHLYHSANYANLSRNLWS
jgi:hypothetical protein